MAARSSASADGETVVAPVGATGAGATVVGVVTATAGGAVATATVSTGIVTSATSGLPLEVHPASKAAATAANNIRLICPSLPINPGPARGKVRAG